jgi:hypothetical protein
MLFFIFLIGNDFLPKFVGIVLNSTFFCAVHKVQLKIIFNWEETAKFKNIFEFLIHPENFFYYVNKFLKEYRRKQLNLNYLQNQKIKIKKKHVDLKNKLDDKINAL